MAEKFAEADAQIRKNQGGRGGIVLCLHDLHDLPAQELADLDATLQALNHNHPDARVTMIAIGNGTLKGICNGPDPARPYLSAPKSLTAETRLPAKLSPRDATELLQNSAHRAGKHWSEDALRRAYAITEGNPVHLQALAELAMDKTDGIFIRPRAVLDAGPEATQRIHDEYAEGAWSHLERNVDARKYRIALRTMPPATQLREMATALGHEGRPRDLEEIRALTDQLIASGHVECDPQGNLALGTPGMRQYIQTILDPTRDADPALPEPIVEQPPALTQGPSAHPDPGLAATERAVEQARADNPWIRTSPTPPAAPERSAEDRIRAMRERVATRPTPASPTRPEPAPPAPQIQR